jgi:hypothetical protein
LPHCSGSCAAGRAVALLRDTHSSAAVDYLHVVMRSPRWRTLDGLALLTVAGAALMIIVTHR